MTPDTPVRRYMSLRAAVQTIRDRTLRFTLVERFRERDPFEGTVPLTVQAQLDVPIMGYYHRHNQQQQLAAHFDKDIRDLLRERPRDLLRDLSERRSAQRRSSYACCWMAGPESMLMWQLYADSNGPGVCLETTLGVLVHSVEGQNLLVRPIFYRDYHVIDGYGFVDDLDLCMQKRVEYKDEREVRLLRYNPGHYNALLSACPPPDLNPHEFFDWNPVLVLDRIVISPNADEVREVEIRAALEAAASVPGFGGKICLSSAHSRRFKPIA